MKELKTDRGIAVLRFTLQHSAAAAAAATSPQSSLIFPQPFLHRAGWKAGRQVQMLLKARLSPEGNAERKRIRESVKEFNRIQSNIFFFCLVY